MVENSVQEVVQPLLLHQRALDSQIQHALSQAEQGEQRQREQHA